MKSHESVTPLPDDAEELKDLVRSLREDLHTFQDRHESIALENQRLQERVNLLELYLYARRSEKVTADDKRQMYLFDEAESGAENESEPISITEESKSRKSGRKGRKPLPSDIPRERVIHDLAPEEKVCPCCGEDRPELKSEISEELVYIPALIKVREHVKLKYGPCKCYDFHQAEEPPILTAKAPSRMLPGSIASASLLAFIITGKYCDALPFYRHERIFKRLGIDISRTNMCNWAIHTASKCAPLIELMREKTREGPLINMDETTLQVLKEPGKRVDSKSYMWVTIGSDSGHRIVLFNYSRTRKAEVALTLLSGFKGSLQSDGYAGYNAARKEYGLWHVGCLAHVRRKFIESAKATKSGGQANKALKYINKLYRIEKSLRSKNLPPEDFVKARRMEAIPVLKDFHIWLKEKQQRAVSSLTFGRAVSYALSEYIKVVRYLKYEYLTPDNNIAENAIRPFVIGRRNWMFSDTPRGAHASAALYSLVETAKANRLEPAHYLHYLFDKIPLVSQKEDLEKLLPWNVRLDS